MKKLACLFLLIVSSAGFCDETPTLEKSRETIFKNVWVDVYYDDFISAYTTLNKIQTNDVNEILYIKLIKLYIASKYNFKAEQRRVLQDIKEEILEKYIDET